MYEEKKKRINWVKLFLVVVIVFLVLLLTLKCISIIKNKNSNNESYYSKQLNVINDVALDYYNKDNIPKEVGKSSKKTLNELKEEKVEFKLETKKGETCDLDNSYIQATRLETEYQVKTYLICGEYSDYINTYVDLNDSKKETTTAKKEETTTKEVTTEEVKTTTTTTTTKVVTTQMVTTTTTRVFNTTQATVKAATDKEITIGFNANGGTVNTMYKTINKGTSTELPVPVRNGYNFRGWYYNGVKYTSKTKFSDSIILVAMWNEN